MTIEQSIQQIGTRSTASLLLNARIKQVTMGMVTIGDLCDNSELCDIIDELEGLLTPIDRQGIKSVLSEINEEFLIDNLYN